MECIDSDGWCLQLTSAPSGAKPLTFRGSLRTAGVISLEKGASGQFTALQMESLVSTG